MLVGLSLIHHEFACGDVVVLQNGQTYAGVLEQITSRSVELYDGNLRRVFACADVKEVVRERPDTSWVMVGDRMLAQRDWDTAGEAYRHALEVTDQPEVVLQRLARLRAYRYALPGSELADVLLQSGRYAEAAQALFELARKAPEGPPRFYWRDRLAEAYVGLSSQKAAAAPTVTDPYLAYALAVSPDCGAVHAALGDRLRAWDYGRVARLEYLLALDLDPVNKRAREGLAAAGKSWTYNSKQTDRSGLRDWIGQQSPMTLDGEAPLTTSALVKALMRRVSQLGAQPVRLLLAAYLLEPTTALAYNGALPYPDCARLIPEILKATGATTETTDYDTGIIRAGVHFRIDPRLLRAIAKVRAGYRVDYVSPDDARGLIPLTLRQWDIAARLRNVNGPFDPQAFDPEKGIGMACQCLEWLRTEALKPYVGTSLERLERVHDNL